MSASSCAAACPPVPKRAATLLSGLDRSSVAAPDIAAVLICVRVVPSTIAVTSPVVPSMRGTVAGTTGMPFSALAGK